MSVSYSDLRRFNAEPGKLHLIVRKVMERNGWTCNSGQEGRLMAEVPVLHGCLTDILTISIHEIGAILVTGSNGVQEFDAGRNQRRVERFIEEVEGWTTGQEHK